MVHIRRRPQILVYTVYNCQEFVRTIVERALELRGARQSGG